MGKITPGVTPEDEFRRVINEAGGNVQINTTPANLLKALKDIGGEVSYGSGDAAIVPTINDGGKDFGPGDFDIVLRYAGLDSTYVWIPLATNCDRLLFMEQNDGINVNSECMREHIPGNTNAKFKDGYFQLWINDEKIPNDNWYISQGHGCLGVEGNKIDNYNAIKKSNGLLGAKIRLKWRSGVFYKGYNDNIQYCTANDITFNYMDNFDPYSPVPRNYDVYDHRFYKQEFKDSSMTLGYSHRTSDLTRSDSAVLHLYKVFANKTNDIKISMLFKNVGWVSSENCVATLDFENAIYKVEGTTVVNGVTRRLLIQISDSIPEYSTSSSGERRLVDVKPFEDKTNTQCSITIFEDNHIWR